MPNFWTHPDDLPRPVPPLTHEMKSAVRIASVVRSEAQWLQWLDEADLGMGVSENVGYIPNEIAI